MKRPILLSALAVLVPIIGCAASSGDDGEASEDALTQATFNASAAKGLARKVVEHGKGDFCVAVKRLPGGTYREEDTKKEDKLCNADFYVDSDKGEDQKAVALCPKIVSTNPGTDVYEIPEGQTKAGIENDAMCANLQALDKMDKIGKYKQTLWCSHTGAVLAAYHVSRALGDIAGVPVAVMRTMDKESHRGVVTRGAKLTTAKFGASSRQFIKRNWNGLWPCLHDGRSDCGTTPETDGLFIQGLGFLWDSDVKASNFKSGHLVGTLMGNASEDGNYPGITTSASLKGNKRYLAATKSGLPFAKGFEQETVQGILAMKDIGDFLILDSIIEQQDRFSEGGGNLSQKKYLMWEQDGASHAERADKKKDAPDTAITVARMVIEDNDCGLRKGMRKARGYDDLLAPVRHLAPSTYNGLQEFAKNIDTQRDVFTQAMVMNNREFDRLAENVKFVASAFATKCASGQLELDLDVDAFIKGEIPKCK